MTITAALTDRAPSIARGAFILMPVRDTGGGVEILPDAANAFHNFRDDLPYRERIVMVGIGQGVSVPFIFQSFHGSGL